MDNIGAQKSLRSIGTHDGSFHADEVTACALLLLFNLIDKDKIIRTRDPKVLEKCEYVCDVGLIYNPARKLFDHHQADYKGPMSSAGMILLYLKDQQIINSKEYEFFNHSLIMGVDAHDNGKDPQTIGLCTYSHVISSFAPLSHEADDETLNRAFFEALNFARSFLERIWERYKYSLSCRKIIEDTMNRDKLCLMFDTNIPWLESFFELGGENHPSLFMIMPSGKHWKLRGIPPTYEQRMKVRQPLPEEWAGLLEEELKKVSGIPGAIFCHKGRFISVWETKEDAIAALNKIIETT